MAGLEIVIGTYEEYTLGFKVDKLKTDTSVQCLKQIFACHNHTSSIRSLASFEHYLASGGADDRICLIDLKERSEFNQLMGHDGTINSLAFTPDGKFLLSCGSDGKMIATNTATWITHKTWPKAHKGSVDYISIHPDGQMALTIGSDMNLKTWNMVDGRQVFVVNLKKQEIHGGSIFIVEWSPDGDHFALVGNKGVVVLSVNTTLPVKTIKTEVKPTSFCWIDNEFLAVGLDDGHFIYSSIHSNVEDQIQMEKCRIKAISSYNNYLATATSAGDVSLWLLGNDTVDQVCTTNIGCRPICLLIVDAAKYDMEYKVKEESKDEQTNLKKIQSVGTVVIENDDEENHDEDIEEVEKAKKAEKEEEIKDQDTEGIKKTEDNEDQIMETPMKKDKKHKKKDKKLDFIEVAGEIAENDKKESIVEEQKEEIKDQDIESMNKLEDNEDQIMETPMKKDKKHKKKDKKLDFIELDGEIAENDDQIKKSAKKSSKKKKNAFIEEDLNGDDEEIPKTDKKLTKRKAKPTDFIEEDIGEDVLSESPAKKKKVPEKTPKKKKIAREIEFLVEDQDDLLSKSMDEKPSKKAHKNKKHNKTLA